MSEDKLRAALIDAIAVELTELGYRPCSEPGFLQNREEPSRRVGEEVWRRVKEILREREHRE